jgi:hypothetical protein
VVLCWFLENIYCIHHVNISSDEKGIQNVRGKTGQDIE